MNSMIDPQNEVASFATVAPEEFYGAYNGTEDNTVDNVPTCDDVAEPVYDDVADDANQYVDDVYWGLAGRLARALLGPTPPPPPGGGGGGADSVPRWLARFLLRYCITISAYHTTCLTIRCV